MLEVLLAGDVTAQSIERVRAWRTKFKHQKSWDELVRHDFFDVMGMCRIGLLRRWAVAPTWFCHYSPPLCQARPDIGRGSCPNR